MKNGYPVAYTPQKTTDYEKLVAQAAVLAGCKPLEGPVKVLIECWFQFPKSKDALKKIAANKGQCTKRPDADNLAKGILDSLNSVAYLDDAQVYSLTVTKGYDDTPCVDVTLEYD